MGPLNAKNRDRVKKAVRLIHAQHLSRSEVARRLGISRVHLWRLLKAGLAHGLKDPA